MPKQDIYRNISSSRLVNQVSYSSYPHLKSSYYAYLNHISLIRDIEATLDFINCTDDSGDLELFYTESGIMSDKVDITTPLETLVEAPGEAPAFSSAGLSSNTPTGQHNLADMSKFLSRPLLLTSGSFALNANATLALRVWNLYTLNPAVRAKIKNYAYLRGNLHIRVSLTGTPFHFGKLLVSYQPCAQRNETLQAIVQFAADIPSGRKMLSNYLSQAMGSTTIDVRDNQPLDIVCPYISTKPMHRLFNSAATIISDITPYNDLSEAGDLYLHILNAFDIASTGTDPVRYFVYAWMEDVELGCPTGTLATIRTESLDERDIGPLEKFASGASEISKSLSVIPIIRPFSLASHITFSALEKVSAIFGWSKPVLIDSPVYVKNNAFQNGAVTIGYDTNARIVLDPKQELTVDPRVVGVSTDDMVIADLASRKTFLHTFAWTPSTPTMVPLWSCGVTPGLSTYATANSHTFFQPTAMAFSAAPFQSWRGDIEFHFEIVCSQFHRGKFLVYFEPNINQNTIISASMDLNKQYIKLIDIQETQNVSFTVEWAHSQEWCNAFNEQQSGSTVFPYIQDISSTLTIHDKRAFNGVIYFVPFNDLVSPTDLGISVNVYVSSPNLMVNRATMYNVPCHRAEHMPVIEEAKFVTESMSQTSQPLSKFTLNPSASNTEHICRDHYGERPVSFRSLLKRYVTQSQTSSTAVDQDNFVVFDAPIIPESNIITGDTATPDFVTLYDFLRPAYLAMRGSLRRRLTVVSNGTPPPSHSYTKVSLLPDSNLYASTFVSLVGILGVSRHKATLDGTITYDLPSNGGLEFELPFYSTNLFAYSFAADTIGSNPGGEQNMNDTWARMYQVTFPVYGATHVSIQEDLATGEDFSFMRYSGAAYYSRTLT